MRTLLILLLASCGVADAVDGEADDPADCCWLLGDGAVARCVRNSLDETDSWEEYDRNGDGCIDVRCFPKTIDNHVLVCPE